jgi:hypothetical protein
MAEWEEYDHSGHIYHNYDASQHYNGNTVVISLVDGLEHFLSFHNIWDNPSYWLIFFKMVKTTNQMNMIQYGDKYKVS